MKGLIDDIVASAEWRGRELEMLKRIGLISIVDTPRETKNQFYRMCIPYIYAHWEGFVVETFKQLTKYINDLKLEKTNVCIALYTFSLQDVLRPLSGKQGFEQSCKFTQTFVEQFSTPLYIDPKLVSAKSNLNYSQTNEIFLKFGMKNPLEIYSQDINQLVNQRNKIAHGESGITVDFENIAEKIRVLQEIFDKIILCIDEYLISEGYLKMR